MSPAAAQKARRHAARAKGLCGQCCIAPATPGKFRCERCYAIHLKGKGAAHRYRCSACQQLGHNRATCPTLVQPTPSRSIRLTSACECGGIKSVYAEGCADCMRIEKERRDVDTGRYWVLSRVRNERDWVMATDVANDMSMERDRVFWWLNRLTNEGELEQERIPGLGVVYRARRAA